MRLICWNMRRARADSSAWDYFRDLDADIAALQEVGSVPEDLKREYSVRTRTPVTKNGGLQRFSTALLVRGEVLDEVPLRSSHPWVNSLLDHFSGNLLSYLVTLPDGFKVHLVNVYSPAWPIPKELYDGVDVSGIKLDQNPDVWLTDLVTAALSNRGEARRDGWLVVGDFNSCVTFDAWEGGPRGNQEWLDRMSEIGFTECLSAHNGKMVPTFKVARESNATCQIDKVFATSDLVDRLHHCSVGESSRVFGDSLSDHLPIIAEFKSMEVA